MTRTQKIDLAKICTSGLFFAFGLATNSIWFFLAAYAIAGYKTIIEAAYGIMNRQFLDENFLMTIASLGAFYCQEYPEAVAVMLFYQVGEFFEHYAVNRSRKSIADLMDIRPDYAVRLREDGTEETIDPEELSIGDLILVRPGEKVPVDGVVLSGTSTLDTAALTGESLPRDTSPGQEIISGTINVSGALQVQVIRPFEDSTIAKVLDLVENASSKKASVEKFITKFARYYTPLVVLSAVLLAVLPPLLMPQQVFADWLYRAMIFLVISCPCALVISVPLSLFAGVGSASKQGILVKGSNYLEALSNVETFAFDKTGTLTTGRFTVTAISVARKEDLNADQLLSIAAHGEALSNHPIALSIVEEYEKAGKTVNRALIADYEEIPGKGISCKVDGSLVSCGNAKMMTDLGFDVAAPSNVGSAVYVACNGFYLGYLVVADTLRENSKDTIAALKGLGVNHTVMLTGDRSEIAETVGTTLGIDQILAELLPGDKVSAFESLVTQNNNGRSVFVGDGINDAPVLARADVGIAMGAFGSDAAIEAADIVIMNDDISKLTDVMKIARKTLRICKQNVIFALTIKFGVMILGALGIASMWAAVFADVGVAIIAILNAMRALRFHK
ncbi:MAG: cadmium-translocating P-type ATPase [Firmicutes bacterium]|nr:cadmium-translocating P-type ATPase [Bacillota bacterium]